MLPKIQDSSMEWNTESGSTSTYLKSTDLDKNAKALLATPTAHGGSQTRG